VVLRRKAGGAFEAVDGALEVLAALAQPRDTAQQRDVVGLLLQLGLGLVEFARELLGAQLQALLRLELLLQALVLDQLARALRLLDAGALQRPLGGEVLARLQRLLVARVDLQRHLVHLERLLQLALLVQQRAGGAARRQAARLLLREAREHGQRRAAQAGALQRRRERQVGALAERIGDDVALEAARGRGVAADQPQQVARQQIEAAAEQRADLARFLLRDLREQRLLQPLARLAVVRLELQHLQVGLDRERVIAPLDGVGSVLEVLGEVDHFVRPGSTVA
jgi:hypothetical protein